MKATSMLHLMNILSELYRRKVLNSPRFVWHFAGPGWRNIGTDGAERGIYDGPGSFFVFLAAASRLVY